MLAFHTSSYDVRAQDVETITERKIQSVEKSPTGVEKKPSDASRFSEQLKLLLKSFKTDPQQVSQQWLSPLNPSQSSSPAGPDVFMLPDEDGKLRMVLGFRYEDFLKTWQQQDEATNLSPPQYVFKSLDVQGVVEKTRVHLEVEVQVLTQADGWMEIPLQMSGLVVQNFEIENALEGECVVYDGNRQSYILWLKGQPGSQRRLLLAGLHRLAVTDGDPSLELSVPRTTNSSLALQIPTLAEQIQTPLGMNIESITNDDKGTHIQVAGPVTPMRLQWKIPKAKKSKSNLVIEATGQQSVRIARRSIRYEINLKIDSFGAPLDHVRVQLPAGSKLVSDLKSTKYRIDPVVADPQNNRSTVEISIPDPESEDSKLSSTLPWEVQLIAEQTIVEEQRQFACFVSGFEVLDAYRQSGTLDLQIEDPLQAYFDLTGSLDQIPLVEQNEQDSKIKTIARFSYSQFPWELAVHILPRQQRVTVHPQYEMAIEYDLSVESGEARLQVEFDYQLTGTSTFFLRIDMHGWRLTDDPLESGGTINQELKTISDKGLLNLPLLNSDTSRVRLNFVAHKEIQLGSNTFELPEPLGVFVADGLLEVECEPALQVTPRLTSSDGLSRMAFDEQSTFQESQDSHSLDASEKRGDLVNNLAFRTYQSAPKLSTVITQREREVFADVNTEIKIASDLIHVSQEIDYQVKYRSVSRLLIHVPNEIWLNDSLVIQLDGEDVEYGLEIDSQEDLTSDFLAPDLEAKRLIVALPSPQKGNFKIGLAYDIPSPLLTNNTLLPVSFPLAAPDLPVQGHLVKLFYDQPLHVSLNQLAAGEDWLYSSTEDEWVQLHSEQSPTVLPIHLQLDPEEAPELATLERAWLQNWIVTDLQQVRAVFRFRSPHPYAFVQLPGPIDANALEVLLEGTPAAFEVLPGNRLSIGVLEDSAHRSQTLEIRYQSSVRLSDWESLLMRLPILESRSSKTPVYWQLILPSHWHIAREPEKFTGDYWLGWKDYHWGRHPNMYQADLERLTGAASMPPPPESMNQYLFQSFQQTAEIEILILQRSWVVLGSTLLAFGVGLLCLYTKLLLRKEFWLILALVLFVQVFIYPEISLLVIQVIFWGGMMTLLTGVLRKLTTAPGRDSASALGSVTVSTAATESWSQAEVTAPLEKQGGSTAKRESSMQVGEQG